MSICCCSLAGTAACQHCPQNQFATEVWANNTVTTDHVDAQPFGNGIDVCPVCGKPSTIGKPKTNADRVRSMSDEELAEIITMICPPQNKTCFYEDEEDLPCVRCWAAWLKSPAKGEQDG